MKIVVDNKIWAAYLLSGDNRVEKLLGYIGSENATLLLSNTVLKNLVDLVKRPAIRKYLNNNLIENFLHLLLEKSQIIHPNLTIKNKTAKKDTLYANLAASGKAQYLITTKEEFYRFSKLDGYRLLNVIELKTFVENAES